MKMLKFFATAMLFVIAGTSLIEAKKGCSSKIKATCNGGCEWRHDKCRSKVNPKPAVPSQFNNMLENDMPCTFYTADPATGGTIVPTTALSNVNGVLMIGGNDGTSTDYTLTVPAGATFVQVGPDGGPNATDGDTKDNRTASLGGLVAGKTYQITSDANGFLIVQAA